MTTVKKVQDARACAAALARAARILDRRRVGLRVRLVPCEAPLGAAAKRRVHAELVAALLVMFSACGSVSVDPSVVPDASADVGSAGRQVEGGSGGAGGEPAPPADAGVAGPASAPPVACVANGQIADTTECADPCVSTCIRCKGLPGCTRGRAAGGLYYVSSCGDCP